MMYERSAKRKGRRQMEGPRDGDRLFAGGPEGDDERKRTGSRCDRQKREKERKKEKSDRSERE